MRNMFGHKIGEIERPNQLSIMLFVQLLNVIQSSNTRLTKGPSVRTGPKSAEIATVNCIAGGAAKSHALNRCANSRVKDSSTFVGGFCTFMSVYLQSVDA